MKKGLLLITMIVFCSFVFFGCGGTNSKNGSVGEAASGTQKEQVEAKTEPAEPTKVQNEAEKDVNSDAGMDEGNAIYKDYYDIVSKADPKQWDGFALIDLDGDGVNELFATFIDGKREDPGIQPYMIVGYNNTAIINDELQDGVAGAGGYRGTLYYLEGKGILHESMVYAPFGTPADTIYALKDGKIEIMGQGGFTVDDFAGSEDEGWDPLEHGSWTWNGQNVTEEEYNGKVREATNDTEGLPMSEIDWKSKEDIQKELER